MSLPDTAGWARVGATDNAEVYVVEDGVLAVVPHDRCVDDAATARQSIALQDAHWREVGHRGGAVVFMDPILTQESGAREVYARETGETLSTCYALVGGTLFGRAIASVFVGLSRPAVPTRFFATLDEALPWVREQNRTRGGPS